MMFFYRHGVQNGVRGVYISTEYSDERFWFGELDDIKQKSPFCHFKNAEWVDFSGRH